MEFVFALYNTRRNTDSLWILLCPLWREVEKYNKEGRNSEQNQERAREDKAHNSQELVDLELPISSTFLNTVFHLRVT
jgi:hypothetical protein